MADWRTVIAQLNALISHCAARPQRVLAIDPETSVAETTKRLQELEAQADQKLDSLCSQFARTGFLPDSDPIGSFFLLRRAIYARNFSSVCMHPRNTSPDAIADISSVPQPEILEWLLIRVWEPLGRQSLAFEIASQSGDTPSRL